MKKLITALLLIVSSITAHADSLSFTLSNKHIVKERLDYPYNENNPGFIYHYDSGYFVGAYYNSYYDISPIVGKRWEDGLFGLEISAIYFPRYENETIQTIQPIVHATIDVGWFRLGLVPTPIDNGITVLTMQYVVKLD